MNSSVKIAELIKTFSLTAPDPKQDHPWHLYHLHADFVELKCMLWDRESVLAMQDIITHYKDFGIDTGLKRSRLAVDQASSDISEINDLWEDKMKEIFEVIDDRSVIFGDDYPFLVIKKSLKLKEELSLRNKLYLVLLVSSNLNNFSLVKQILTSEFETISKYLLEDFFPKINIEEFGQNTKFKGNTQAKIEKLSSLMHIKFRPDYIASFSKKANKEKGLDIVGWGPFTDDIANMVIFLGQCACGKDWTDKIAETKAYETYLDFVRLHPLHAMFIPYGLAHYDYNFYQADKTNGLLFFERKRFLDISDYKLEQLKKLKSFVIIDELLANDFVEV